MFYRTFLSSLLMPTRWHSPSLHAYKIHHGTGAVGPRTVYARSQAITKAASPDALTTPCKSLMSPRAVPPEFQSAMRRYNVHVPGTSRAVCLGYLHVPRPPSGGSQWRSQRLCGHLPTHMPITCHPSLLRPATTAPELLARASGARASERAMGLVGPATPPRALTLIVLSCPLPACLPLPAACLLLPACCPPLELALAASASSHSPERARAPGHAPRRARRGFSG